jgi:hypothetical protein
LHQCCVEMGITNKRSRGHIAHLGHISKYFPYKHMLNYFSLLLQPLPLRDHITEKRPNEHRKSSACWTLPSNSMMRTGGIKWFDMLIGFCEKEKRSEDTGWLMIYRTPTDDKKNNINTMYQKIPVWNFSMIAIQYNFVLYCNIPIFQYIVTPLMCLYMYRKYFKNLLKNQWTRKAELYMKAFYYSTKASLFKSWPPGSGGAKVNCFYICLYI